MPAPGEVFLLPSADPEFGDPKDGRPHILVSQTSVDPSIATVVYCSTQTWEISRYAPPHVVIDESGSAFALTGLHTTTVAYPGRLVLCDVADLTQKVGVLPDELGQLQSELLRAIGFRTGVSKSTGSAASGSFRGVVVRFRADFVKYLGAEFGVIVSEPAYSRRELFQNFVPIFPSGEISATDGIVAVEVEPLLTAPPVQMHAAACLVQSMKQTDIADVVGHMTATSMRALEDALAVRFFKSVVVAETVSL